LHDVKEVFKQKDIDFEWLNFVKINLDKNIQNKWLFTDFILVLFENGYLTNFQFYDRILEILQIEYRKKIAFFKSDMSFIISQNNNIGNSKQLIINKLNSYIIEIENKVGDDLMQLGDTNSIIRYIILKLLLNIDTISLIIDDAKYEQYKKNIYDLRLDKLKITSEINNLEMYFQYSKNLQVQYNHLLDTELERKKSYIQNVFIIESKMEKINNYDEIRLELLDILENLQNIMKRKQEEFELQDEINKLKSNTYQIAVIAAMSAGKSTLINAMLGDELLPALLKSCTGRLTYINHVEGETFVNISLKNNLLILTFEEVVDLELFINKYGIEDWFESTEIYTNSKLNISKEIITKSSDVCFIDIKKENYIFENQAKIITKKNNFKSIKLSNPTQKELGYFINNESVSSIEINTPIHHLKKHLPIDNIQIVDTPGPDSAAHSDHKRITYDFIDKANAVIFVIDITHFPNTTDKQLLDEVKKIREKSNKQFYEKFFFVVNKIDAHDMYNDGSLDTRLNSIKDTLINYGYKIQVDHFTAISSKAGLLYRMFNANKLDDRRMQTFSSFWAPLVESVDWSENGIKLAKQKVLEFSRIDSLENTICNYLKNCNITKELIDDAKKKSYCFAENLRTDISAEKARVSKPLNDLEIEFQKLEKWIKETEKEKEKIKTKLNSNSFEFLKVILSKFIEFEQDIIYVIEVAFGEQVSNKQCNIELPDLEQVRKAVQNFNQKAKSDAELKGYVRAYNEKMTYALQNLYSNFESELKIFASEKRTKIYNEAYQKANNILQDLNRKIGDNLNIELNTTNNIFPQLQLKSVINITDEVYKSIEKEEKKWKEGGFCSSGKWLYNKIIERHVNISKVMNLTIDAIKNATKITKGATKALIDNDKALMINSIFSSIEKHTATLRKNLSATIEQRKTVGFDVEKELQSIEVKLDEINILISQLDILTKKIQTNN